ncbi:hypothetical protein FRC07_001882 [Ceratobasidium sp. 392]|nr:hypothetical protein FRC07_001882 [Ceratobasidium sp. 392]
MSDRSPPKKKQKYAPDRPQALSTPATFLRASDSRSRSSPRVENAASPMAATSRRATSAHPTAPQTTRRPGNTAMVSRLAPIPAPAFRSDTESCGPLKNVEDPKSSDEESSSESSSSDSKSSSSRSELKNSARPVEAPMPTELHISSSPAREQTPKLAAREREREATLAAESSSERTPTPPPKPSRGTPVPASNLSRAPHPPKVVQRRPKAPARVVDVTERMERKLVDRDRELVDRDRESALVDPDLD